MSSNLEEALQDLVAIERDRRLGYTEFHMDQKVALENAIDALEGAGWDRDEIILPEDQEKLDLSGE